MFNTEENLWLRAKVIQVIKQKKMIIVQYVDYGFREYVETGFSREMTKTLNSGQIRVLPVTRRVDENNNESGMVGSADASSMQKLFVRYPTRAIACRIADCEDDTASEAVFRHVNRLKEESFVIAGFKPPVGVAAGEIKLTNLDGIDFRQLLRDLDGGAANFKYVLVCVGSFDSLQYHLFGSL